MKTTLSSVGSVSVIPGQSVSESEGIHDACRAYGLLLHSSQLREIQEHSEVSAQVNYTCLCIFTRLLCTDFHKGSVYMSTLFQLF